MVSEGATFSQFLAADDFLLLLWQEEDLQEGGQAIFLSLAVSEDGETWEENRKFLGPLPFIGREIPFFDAVLSSDGTLRLAVSEEDGRIHIYVSRNRGKTFQSLSVTKPLPVRVIPRLFQTAAGGNLLFISQPQSSVVAASLGMNYSYSSTGMVWSEFQSIGVEENLRGAFLPSHLSFAGAEYVFFQSLHLADTPTFQIYMKRSEDGGRTWGPSVHLSDFSGNETGIGPFDYENQRPYPMVHTDRLFLTWERNLPYQQSQVYYAELEADGSFVAPPEKVSRGWNVCRNPRALFHNGMLLVLWFDNRAGDNRVILARRTDLHWESYDLTSLLQGNFQFASFLTYKEHLYVLWENDYQDRSRLVLLPPDRTVTTPVLRASNFLPERPAKQDNFIIRWNSPADSSGIAGYSYSWSRFLGSSPPPRLMTLDRNRVAQGNIKEDGLWYFHLIAQDYAGNWSKPATIPFIRDTTPPEPVVFAPPQEDGEGYLSSNTGVVNWMPPAGDPYIVGYAWQFQYLANSDFDGDFDGFNILPPPSRMMDNTREVQFVNQDNGLWALTVRAFDVAGNLGVPASIPLRLNKYVPVTYITGVKAQEDALGNYSLSLTGRGFSVGGKIDKIIIDEDKKEPYKLVVSADTGLYQVETDRFIQGPLLEGLDASDYWVGVVHPTRGLHFFRRPLSLADLGTVKFGNFGASPGSKLRPTRPARFTLSFSTFFLAVFMIFLGIMVVLMVRRLVAVVGEGLALQHQVRSLITGKEWTHAERQGRFEEMKKKGMGLRIKFALLITILVLLLVAMVSIPLAYLTNRQQEELLANGLLQRVEVLMESLASGARTYLPTQNILELGTLPEQMGAMGQEALFVTITGPPAVKEEEGVNWVWATNDESFLKGERLQAGKLLLEDSISPSLIPLAEKLNREASARVTEISQEIQYLNGRVEPLIAEFVRTADPETEEVINEIQEKLSLLYAILNSRLFEVGNQVFSEPAYDPTALSRENTRYIFYKPVLFREEGETVYYRGTVRLGIATDTILADIQASRRQLFSIIGVVAVAAIILGVLGALGLAAIIIRPIHILARGIEVIRDAKDIAKELKDHSIETKTRDELSLLADTINQMTVRLVDAANANQMLLMGKDVQKQYLSLDKLEGSNVKATTVKKEDANIALFGYYEGALGVSGDLFDYKEVDADHVAFIKGDVSGKGVPAALIMVQVATLFTYFFATWKSRNDERLMQGKKGLALPDIADLVDQTNNLLDFIGAAQAGRFAAFIVGILNVKTGKCRLCHAGDNLVHIYDNTKGMYTRQLGDRPTAGSFPSDMVKMQMGFTTEVQVMKKHDALILYTDGLEEAQRHFRDANFKLIECEEPVPEVEGKRRHGDEQNGSHPVGGNFEELGSTRIHEIVNTVFDRGIYRLYKYHNPLGEEDLIFDFTSCEGTIEEAVIALVAVEKVFRIYPDPSAGLQDELRVDQRIDDFLRAHFHQFDSYFRYPIAEKKGISSEDAQLYRYYSHMKEDHQYDDLTVLGIMKK